MSATKYFFFLFLTSHFKSVKYGGTYFALFENLGILREKIVFLTFPCKSRLEAESFS